MSTQERTTGRITYSIAIVGNQFGLSGTYKHQRTRTFEVEEERTLMGAMRATAAAYVLAEAKVSDVWAIAEDYSPYLTPNPDGTWELGA